MRTMIIVKDLITGNVSHGPVDELADALTDWNPDAPTDVRDAIAEIQTAALRGEWHTVSKLAAYLAVDVEL